MSTFIELSSEKASDLVMTTTDLGQKLIRNDHSPGIFTSTLVQMESVVALHASFPYLFRGLISSSCFVHEFVSKYVA